MTISAKVFVSGITKLANGETSVHFNADYADGRNKEWAKYTPGLSLGMTVLDEIVEREGFVYGKRYTLLFEPDAVVEQSIESDVESEVRLTTALLPEEDQK